jgi:hypothetical protein
MAQKAKRAYVHSSWDGLTPHQSRLDKMRLGIGRILLCLAPQRWQITSRPTAPIQPAFTGYAGRRTALTRNSTTATATSGGRKLLLCAGAQIMLIGMLGQSKSAGSGMERIFGLPSGGRPAAN